MNEKIRVYGKTVNRWTSEDEKGRVYTTQYEIEYKEYDKEWNLVGAGTEDFSPERLHKEVEAKFVYTWDGQKRNKGGYRWFEAQGHVKVRKSCIKLYKEMVKAKYNAEMVDLRKGVL